MEMEVLQSLIYISVYGKKIDTTRLCYLIGGLHGDYYKDSFFILANQGEDWVAVREFELT